jgi:hypothetical protein
LKLHPSIFWSTLQNGGFTIWLGEFFIQFFHLPFAGAIIITGSLIFLQQVSKKVLLKITASRDLLILSFLPPAGYLILMLSDFYCFSGIIGLLLSICAAACYLGIGRKNLRILIGLLLIPAVYWLAGGAFFVFVACLIIAELSFKFYEKGRRDPLPLTVIILYMLMAVIIPVLARHFVLLDTLFQSFVSEAYFQLRIFFPLPLIIVFASFPVILFFGALMPEELPSKLKNSIAVLTPVFLIGILTVGIIYYADFDEEQEIRYENLVYTKDWEKIINIAKEKHPDGQISLMALNLAFAETGQLTSELLNFDQKKNSLFLNYERKGMTLFIAAEPFYHAGLINFAQMFAMETVESTPDSKYPCRSFKLIASTFIINGQYDVAMKYLLPLSNTIFYRKWANEAISLLYDEDKINAHPEFGKQRRNIPRYDFYFNKDQLDLALLFLLNANPDNRTAYEYLMAYFLLNKNMEGFLQNIDHAKRMDYKEIPLYFQEAAAYLYNVLPEKPPQLISFPVKSIVMANLNLFFKRFKTDDKNAAENLKKDFGKTYWYYLYFK